MMDMILILAQAGSARGGAWFSPGPALLITAFCVPFVFSMLATPLSARLFAWWGFVDQPKGDRFSTRPVPKGGGIAIFWALALPVLGGLLLVRYCWAVDWRPFYLPAGLEIHFEGIISRTAGALAILAGAAVLHVLGLVDDCRPVKPLTKLIIEFAVAAGLVLFFDVRLLTFLPWHLGTVLTVIWIVLLINIFNFLDNMDGLSAGTAIIVLVIFLWVGQAAQQVFVPTLAVVLLGALAGFLLYNFHPARIFMGDSGSLPLGYLVAVVSVLTTYYDPAVHQGRWYGALVPLVVLAIPLYDFASVVVLRLRAGQRPWVGDRRHFSHRLIERGMSQKRAVLTIYLATAATAVSAVLLPGVSSRGALLIFLQALAVVGIIALLESSGPHSGQNQSG